MTLGGSLTGSEAITAATGNGETRVEVKAVAMLHLLGGELGYPWKPPFGLMIRVVGGAQFTVAKHHRLERAVGVDARSSASNR